MRAWLQTLLGSPSRALKPPRAYLSVERLEDRVVPTADINNGIVRLGINNSGALIAPPLSAPFVSAGGTAGLGIRYMPTNYDATSPGTPVDGWGVADTVTSIFGTDKAGVTTNLSSISITSTANSAVSTVTAGGIFRVTHDYHPSSHPNVYLLVVTIQNISAANTHVEYRRTIDWDIEPTAFSEYVTIQGATRPGVISFTDNGLTTSQNPLIAPMGIPGDVINRGPGDLGASVTFDLGILAPGESTVFNTYYGATGDHATADAALASLAVPIYTVATPSTPGNPVSGTPNTFVYGFNLNPITPTIRAYHPLRYTYDAASNVFTGDLIVTNLSKNKANGPLYAILRDLPPGVTPTNNFSATPLGAPYYVLPGDGSLLGNSSVRIPIKLKNPTGASISTFFQGFTVEVTGAPDDSGAADPSGYVYVDANKNGTRDDGEAGIADVAVEITGTTDDGQPVHDITHTNANGFYHFIVLPGTYTVTETQPGLYRDGLESLGSLGGIVANDSFSGIVVHRGDNGTDYDFGEFINHAPSLAVPDDQFIHAGDGSSDVDLNAADADGDLLNYSARLVGGDGLAALAYQWRENLGLDFNGKYTINKLKLGYQEKWLTGDDRQRYFILPDGELYRFLRRGPLTSQAFIGKLSDAYYNDPSLLWDAAAPAATIELNGNHLTITPRPGYAGALSVEVSASDGLAGDTKSFSVAVGNRAPQITAIDPQQMQADNVLSLDVAASDPDGDALQYTATLADRSDLAWQLKQSLGLVAAAKYSVDRLHHGYGEKLLTGSGRQKYLLLPDGRLYLWNSKRTPLSTQTLIATLSSDYYQNPNLLTNASEPVAKVVMEGAHLSITPRAGFTGTFSVAVRVSDGTTAATQLFSVTVG